MRACTPPLRGLYLHDRSRLRSISSIRIWVVACVVALGCVQWGASAQSHDAGASARSAAVAIEQAPPEVKLPAKWLPSNGRQCTGRSRRGRYCQGPRRVAAPYGPEAELALRLGLGRIETANYLLLEPARAEWIDAAGPPNNEALRWPVDGGRMWRGVDSPGRRPPSWQKNHARKRRRHRHLGVDIGAEVGSLIHAVTSGIVAYSDNRVRGYGNLLMTIHPDGSVAFYAHCRALYVFAGQRIVKGQVVGETGETGITRGPHLHFEYRVEGKPHNPMPLFKNAPDGPQGSANGSSALREK